jgi:(2Fe-2S) ferredoxin
MRTYLITYRDGTTRTLKAIDVWYATLGISQVENIIKIEEIL